jgi:hypothetical protein
MHRCFRRKLEVKSYYTYLQGTLHPGVVSLLMIASGGCINVCCLCTCIRYIHVHLITQTPLLNWTHTQHTYYVRRWSIPLCKPIPHTRTYSHTLLLTLTQQLYFGSSTYIGLKLLLEPKQSQLEYSKYMHTCMYACLECDLLHHFKH